MVTQAPSLVGSDEAPVDEDARRRFEAAWREGRPGPIEHFLPPESHAHYLGTLEELVHIDLELAWKAWGESAGRQGAGSTRAARVEAYLGRFPCLNRPAVVLRLLAQEYRARRLYGDRPALEEYHTRFPELVVTGREIAGTLPEGGPESAELPQVPGYQVLGPLDSGGMGVVYKARQVGLNRVVALKMIRAGAAASAEERARFRTEAEAVARLQHPNVIQIYEVGEQQGRPYFVLELVEGGTLAQHLAGTPQPVRESAALMETLARAMHAAHQRGIVHRDLKPANILLQIPNTKCPISNVQPPMPYGGTAPPGTLVIGHWALGIPKIADFGLAKFLDGGAGQSTTGAPVGTPSYMAPEQARGQKSSIGPATDVYALGAVLYELLTGRPPFRAETALSTLEQVCALDPVPPTRFQPKVPRDLETICLKCLEKEPHRRYATAEELADDLRRFRDGEPVRARPAPVWERGLKWAKRRPALAALLGVSGVAALAVLGMVLVANARLQQQRDLAEEKRQESQAQRQRALAHLRKARQAVDQMLTRVGQDRLAPVPYMETV
jgi:hypothetical protein